MPFQKGQSGNPLGRKVKEKKSYTRKEMREQELLHLIRKLKPNLSCAVKQVITIMNDEESTENGKLKAAALVIQTYNTLVKEIYNGDDDEEGESIEDSGGAVLSLTVLDNTKPKED